MECVLLSIYIADPFRQLAHFNKAAAAGARSARHIMQILRIIEFMRASAQEVVDDGRALASDFPYLRKRPYPGPKRRPRGRRLMESQRIAIALARKAAGEAAAANNSPSGAGS